MNQRAPAVTAIEMETLFRGWRTVSATTVAAMLIAAAFLMTIPPRQEVGAKLIVEPRDAALDGKTISNREKEFLPTQAEVICSPAVISSAVRLIDPGLSEADVADHVSRITGQLKVDPLAGTNILLVRYADATAPRAAELVNALIAGYREYLTSTEQQQQHEMLMALTARDRELQSALTMLQAEYEELKRNHADSAGTDPDTSSRILAALEESLATAESRRQLLDRAEEKLQGRHKAHLTMTNRRTVMTGDLPLAIDMELATYYEVPGSVLQELAALSNEAWIGIRNPASIEAKIHDAQTRVSELTVVLGPKHPELLAGESAVKHYEQELLRYVQGAPAVVQIALDGVRMQEESLQQRYESHLRLAHETEMMRLKESQKLTEIDRAKQSSETLRTQLQQCQLTHQATASGHAGISVAVLEPPIPAERSFAANPLILMGIAGLLGIMFGVSLLVVLPQIRSLLPNLPQVSVAPSAECCGFQESRS